MNEAENAEQATKRKGKEVRGERRSENNTAVNGRTKLNRKQTAGVV